MFFGTPRFAVSILEELEKAGITPSVIVTRPDKPKGRGLELAPSPVKEWALAKEVAVLEPKTLTRDDSQTNFIWNTDWDLFIVTAYGKIIPFEVLKRPQAGTLNVHPSLLPLYRGSSPIESQILADDKKTGVSIMLLDEELDHGPIVAQASVTPLEWPIRASILEQILAQEGGRLLAEVIPAWIEEQHMDSESWLEDGREPTLKPEPQDHTKATSTKKIEKEQGLLDLAADGYQNYLKFCAYDEWPGTHFFIDKKEKSIRVKITDATFKDGIFTPIKVIPEGKKEMGYEDFLRGV